MSCSPSNKVCMLIQPSCVALFFLLRLKVESFSSYLRDLIYVRVKLIFLNVQNNLLSHMKFLYSFALYNSFFVTLLLLTVCCSKWTVFCKWKLFRTDLNDLLLLTKRYKTTKKCEHFSIFFYYYFDENKENERWKRFNTRTNLIKQRREIYIFLYKWV